MTYDLAAFAALQGRLAEWWPVLTVRTIPTRPRVLVVVSSLTADVPEGIRPMIPAYEERYLCYLLALARSEHTRVVYVTSMPMLPRLASYYLDLVKGLEASSAARRLTVVSVGDPSSRPLTQKILERPRLVQRLRDLIGDSRYGVLMPFMTTSIEAELALALDIPIYGPDPSLHYLGSKSGSREVFVASGVPCPRGSTRLRDRDDIVDALIQLQRDHPVQRAVVKSDTGFSGQGNAVVSLEYAVDRVNIAAAVDHVRPDDRALDSSAFLEAFARTGGVVEEWIEGDETCSPSVQLRTSPLGEVEVLSTHLQQLGGPEGQTYLGCTFPAPEPLIQTLTEHGRAIGKELSRRGVIGRFAIDFVMARNASSWRPHALEVNLRNGGTTHPMVTLLALTDGSYDEESGHFEAPTGRKFYSATDHLERPEYMRLTPDDVLDVVNASGLGWDPAMETGVALHMVSGVAGSGTLGATAIADSPSGAVDLMARLEAALDEASDREAWA